MNHLEINENTRFEVDNKRIEKLERKQRPKTKGQRLKGFFYIFFGLGVLCQFLSALLASSGVMYHVSEKLNSNGFILTVTSVFILLAIEASKRFTLESFHNQRLDDGEVQKITYFGIAFFGCLSVASTYFYTPYAVEYFAAAPIMVSIDSINNYYDNELAKDTAILNAELLAHQATAKDIKKSSSWEGRVSRDSRPAYMAATTAAKDVEIKLSQVAISRQKEKSLSVQGAIKENKQIVKQHKDWALSFGGSLALVSIFLEGAFFLAFWWCAGYNRLEVSEAKAIRKLQLKESEVSESSRQEVVSKKETGKEKVVENQAPTSIQFGIASSKEGDIIKGEGRKADRIKVFVAGELRDMTKGDLNRLIKAQSGLERIQHLRTLKNKLG